MTDKIAQTRGTLTWTFLVTGFPAGIVYFVATHGDLLGTLFVGIITGVVSHFVMMAVLMARVHKSGDLKPFLKEAEKLSQEDYEEEDDLFENKDAGEIDWTATMAIRNLSGSEHNIIFKR